MSRDAPGFRISSRWVGSGPMMGSAPVLKQLLSELSVNQNHLKTPFKWPAAEIWDQGLRMHTLGSILILMPPYCLKLGNLCCSEWKHLPQSRHHGHKSAVHRLWDVLAIAAAGCVSSQGSESNNNLCLIAILSSEGIGATGGSCSGTPIGSRP